MANLINVANETFATYSRTTRDGRKLTYEMNVLQQPQRARACGSGAKSSADRRPVDPPPVVELKVFEGENRKDITFQHNANFFLFTTLESARPIAPARGTTGQVPQPHPVLTGMPVAGMAYLDRPTQAGYFIFPDLSVRHEGKFRLSFNLYEELKESKDMDPEGAVPPTPSHEGFAASHFMRSGAMPVMAYVHFRLEVKSAPFTVYSAKKFPGLAESTHLSRLVAEQGCRVRIRRDVRMRRRGETKPSKDYDAYSDEGDGAYGRDRYATPDSYNQHAADRTASTTGSVIDPNSYSLERRQSSNDMGAYYQQQQSSQSQQPYPPAPASAQSSTSSHAAYSSGPSPAYQPSQPSYGGSGGQYSYQQPSNHARQGSASSAAGYPPQSSFQPPAQSRPQSGSYPSYNLPAVDTRFANAASNYSEARSSTPSSHPQLPPLKDITAADPKYAQPATPISASSPSNIDTYSSHPTPTTATSQHGKRSYGRTFDDSHVSSSITQGGRPDAVGLDTIQVECDDGTLVDQDELPSLGMLTYRRADGSKQHKKIPSAF